MCQSRAIDKITTSKSIVNTWLGKIVFKKLVVEEHLSRRFLKGVTHWTVIF